MLDNTRPYRATIATHRRLIRRAVHVSQVLSEAETKRAYDSGVDVDDPVYVRGQAARERMRSERGGRERYETSANGQSWRT